jgi:hypothetical protein
MRHRHTLIEKKTEEGEQRELSRGKKKKKKRERGEELRSQLHPTWTSSPPTTAPTHRLRRLADGAPPRSENGRIPHNRRPPRETTPAETSGRRTLAELRKHLAVDCRPRRSPPPPPRELHRRGQISTIRLRQGTPAKLEFSASPTHAQAFRVRRRSSPATNPRRRPTSLNGGKPAATGLKT